MNFKFKNEATRGNLKKTTEQHNGGHFWNKVYGTFQIIKYYNNYHEKNIYEKLNK